MKKICLILLVTTGLVLNLSAQNWKPGIVVLSTGDTLKGKLSVSAIRTYECLLMRTDGTVEKQTPDRTVSFYIPGEIYFERASLNDGAQVFMNVLASGKADLLERRDFYYLQVDDNELLPLTIEKQSREIDGREYIITREVYKETLRKKLTDCADAQSSINGTALSRKSLARLINQYNACFGVVSEIKSRKPVGKSQLSIGADYTFLRTKIHNLPNTYYKAQENTFDKPQRQNIPGFYLQYSPGIARNFAIQLGVRRMSYQFKYHSMYGTFVPNSTGGYRSIAIDDKYDVHYETIHVPLMFKYSLLNNRFIQPVAGLGIGMQFNRNSGATRDFTNVTDGKNTRTTPDPVKSSGISFIYSVGINVNVGAFRVGGHVHAEYLNSPMDVGPTGISANQTNIGATLSVGYAFVR